MDMTLPPLVSSGFLPVGSLLESLIHISNEVASIEKFPVVQVKNVSMMIRRVKLLSSLFQEIQETNAPLPPSSILCLTELFSVIRRVKLLIDGCKEGSALWNLMQTDLLSNQYHVTVKEMGSALDILPLSLLKITIDTKEQVELLRKQAKRVELFVEPGEIQRREELFLMMGSYRDRNKRNTGLDDFNRVKEILISIGVRSPLDFEEEISKLEAEAEKQAGTGGLIVVSNINNLMSLISLSKSMIFSRENKEKIPEDLKQSSASNWQHEHSSSSQSSFNIPDEYRCPISLDLMRDPVIVASGHTYDRNSIAQWINTGHHTCPKSGQRLIHMALIPNYALKSLIHQWCEENNITIRESTSSPPDLDRSSGKRELQDKAVDHISATKTASDAVKMTAEFLVGKLATGSPDIQRQAAYELRLLAKTGSLDSIIHVLLSGKTMEARENAAATIFSLSMVDDYKVLIGGHPKAIPALVELLIDGTTAGKRDAATALFNLAVYNINKSCVAVSGAIPLLIELLMDDKAGITDDALAVLALLLGCSEGLEEIKKSRVLVPLLIDLLRYGSPKGKENSITLLLGLCKDSGEEVARRLLMNPRSIPSLQSLAADGSLKARRKADALLRLLNRCCFQS
ncbi:U-box domain-containing protein 1 isoform X2 [Daucus carota subsp. sativus]|uniref:U-box domain-containing protein 1 isoform X2 n=1 Tax=Daucus carota subsp. sativus TaxID=79200 RepID=UPI0007EFD995|nr:PREDICTED: U-box domain-containing protein 1-like isoform X2 [Daucus carota subsp. sativus]